MIKQLADKAVKIQGKSYVLVSDRVLFFNENYPNGSIKTKLLSNPENNRIVIKAIITPDCKESRQFIAHAQENVGEGFINKNSALENAETSAVGRALAMMGIGVIESIASADEIKKAQNHDMVEREFQKIEDEMDRDPLTTHQPLDSEKICPECNGIMKHKTGVKNGKTWSGWFCSVKGHKPIWN